MSTGNTRDLFNLILDLEMYTNALDQGKDCGDVVLATISEIRLHLEKFMLTMPTTATIIMNYLDSIEERIR